MAPRDTGRHYDAIAALWDDARRTSSYGVEFVERAIALCASRRRALDVGCGSGGPLLDRMIGAGFHVTGIDVSEAMLAIAGVRYRAVELIHADAAQWVPNDRFDLIVAWDSLFHLPHALHEPVIGKLCRALDPGGVLLLTAGGVDGARSGSMHGQVFDYSSLSEEALVTLLRQAGCVPTLVTRDQDPLDHLVLIASSTRGNPPEQSPRATRGARPKRFR